MSDEDEKTPVRTPSALQKLGLVPCPHCKKTKIEPNKFLNPDGTKKCTLCDGGGAVPVDVGIEYRKNFPEH